MATKAGKIQLKDIKQGKTFYEVILNIKGWSSFEVHITQVFCNSRPFLKGKKSYKTTSMSKIYERSYRNSPLLWTSTGNFETQYWNINSMFITSANIGPNDNRHNPDRIGFQWFFVTRAHAEKFVKDLNLTFVPSDQQIENARISERYSEKFYRELKF